MIDEDLEMMILMMRTITIASSSRRRGHAVRIFYFWNSQSHLFIKLDIHTLNKAIMHTY